MNIGPYEVVSVLGRGGAGVVYRARDRKLERDVAIKTLAAADASPTMRARFTREAQALARLRHPGIVSVLAVGETEPDESGAPSEPYIVMELVEGPSLRRLLAEQGPLAPQAAVGMALALARAVAAAHAQSILHRDIKPDNVIVEVDGTPRLTDFGLAKDLAATLESSATTAGGTLTVRGRCLGTPGYWAPEQAVGDHDRLGPPTDVYGLGGTLYAMLTGQGPFADLDSIVELVVAAQQRLPQPPSAHPRARDVDPALDAICLRCLAKDPTDRYSDGEALAAALERWLAGDRHVTAVPHRIRVSDLRRAGRLQGLLAGLAIGAASSLVVAAALPAAGVETTGGVPPASEALLQAARGFHDANQHERAIEIASRLLVSSPDLVAARLQRASCRLELADPAGAIVDLDRIIELAPRNVVAHRRRGNALRDLKDIAGAAASYERALAIDPTDARTLYRRGLMRREGGDADGAIADLTGAIESDPEWAAPYFRRGLIRDEARGDLQGAIVDYARSLALAPDDPDSWNNRGWCRRRLGDLDGAITDFTRAIRVDPSYALAYRNRGDAHAERGDVAAALADYATAIELFPDSAYSYSRRGRLLHRQGDLAAAIADATRAIELDPELGDGWALRGRCRLGQGDASGARADLERALELLDAEGPAAARAREELEQARGASGD